MVRARQAVAVAWLALLIVPTARAGQPDIDAETFFETKVRPVLAARCFKCHGGNKTSSGLRVDSRESLVAGGEHGAAVVPGDPRASLLVRAIGRQEDRKMPPDEPLPVDEVAALETWIRQGALWPKAADATAFTAKRHWAFEPVRPVEPPDDPGGWAASPIDRFIAQAHRQHGLQPRQPADRAALLRRLSFDLTGLPPTPAETENFLADDSPQAWPRAIERLLASPAYGERWGRHWMDVVRYADTAGDNADYPVPEAARYRDYIIKAFNDDKPYDEFLREQLAGDILARRQPQPPEQYAERVAATGFLALSRRYGTAPYELWHLTLEDTIDTTGRAILGLSLRCARCHDHKFDPVTTEDYYALYGIFASTQFPWAGGEELQSKKFDRQHFVPLVPPQEIQPQVEALGKQVAELKTRIEHAEKDDPDAIRVAELDAIIKAASTDSAAETTSSSQANVATLKKERGEVNRRLQKRLEEMRKVLRALSRPSLPAGVPGAYAVLEGQPADARVQRQGEPTQLADVAARGAPKFLAGDEPIEIPAGASGRLQLADWLVRPEHPLTARVLVNRVWQYHFGKGLVATPSDFGLRGEPPTHGELLDWLTAQFVHGGWSIKNLHRLIVGSRTYQLASSHDEASAAIDPANRWYWRFERRRLEAEAIRDAMLAVAGALEPGAPREHPFPPIDSWNWTQHDPFKAVYPSSLRSVYLMTQRIQRHPYLALFDGPDPNVSTDSRTSATVPLQALYWMNNPFVGEQAGRFARRLIDAERELSSRARLAILIAFGRAPHSGECAAAIEYCKAYAAASGAGDAAAGEPQAWTSYARLLLTANEFVYID